MTTASSATEPARSTGINDDPASTPQVQDANPEKPTKTAARKTSTRTRKAPSKAATQDASLVETLQGLPWGQLWKPLAVLVAVITIVSTALSVILLSIIFRPGVAENTGSATSAPVGTSVVEPLASDTLTEAELRSFISDAGVGAFWVGAEPDATYTVTVRSTQDVLIRYIPQGASAEELGDQTLMIATYPVPDAYSALETAAQEPNAISSISEDGALLFYRSDLPSNVYLAYPDQAFQIEVFDPVGGRALELATEPGKVQPVN